MKRLLTVLTFMIVAVLLTGAPASLAQTGPAATIELLNPPKNGLLELAVGESYTFDIEILSDEPFVVAVAMTDAYYPGRGVFWHGSDRASQATSALLHLTVKGKEPTDFLPEGVVPIAVVVGVRFRGGLVFSERFDLVVSVVPEEGAQ